VLQNLTKTFPKDRADAVLQRLLGEAVAVLNRQPVAAGNWITGEVLTVASCTTATTEVQGRLIALPVGEDEQAIQLAYFLPQLEGAESLLLSIQYHPQFFEQWPRKLLGASILDWPVAKIKEVQFVPNTLVQTLVREMLAGGPDSKTFSDAVLQSERALRLLRHALDAVSMAFTPCAIPACRFLANDLEREKIEAARNLLMSHTERPLTIKDLARKVAINECYLKKGFKALTGKTIHEFQHERRMAHALTLLQEGNTTVSEVAAELGFLSISHFSTAFKKATGAKPCDLLR
jgi:AraC-like DNA-binding protein